MAFGFDPSIILSARRSSQQADPLGNARSMADLLRARQGMQIQREQHQQTLASLLQKQQREQRLSEIFSKNAGNPAGVAQALAGAGFGQEALDWTERSAAARKAFQEGLRQQAEFIGRPFRSGVKSQADVDAAFAALERAGMAPDQLAGLPREYNEQTAPVFARLAALGMSTEDAEKLAQRDEELAARQEDRAAQRALTKLLLEQRQGEKSDAKLDKEIETLSKRMESAPAIKNDLATLDKFASKEDIPGIGPVAGRLPEWSLSPEGVQVRQAAKGIIGALIKEQSGAAATEAEVARKLAELGMSDGVTEQQFRLGLERLKANVRDALKQKEAGARPEAVKEARTRGLTTSADLPAPRGGGTVSAGGAPPRIASDAEYDALPSGADFIGPDGKRRRKP